MVRNLEESLQTCDAQREQEQRKFIDALRNLERSTEETKDLINKLNAEKRDLITELNTARAECQRAKADASEARSENAIMQQKLYNADSYQEVIKSMQSAKEELQIQLQSNKKAQAE